MSKEPNWQENNVRDASDDNIWDKQEPLVGKLVKIEHDVGPNDSTMYTVKKDDGSEVKVWGSTVLDDRFLGLPEGAYVKVNYEGLKKGKNGKGYHNYKVFVDLDSQPEPAEDVRVTEREVDEPINLDDIPF